MQGILSNGASLSGLPLLIINDAHLLPIDTPQINLKNFPQLISFVITLGYTNHCQKSGDSSQGAECLMLDTLFWMLDEKSCQ